MIEISGSDNRDRDRLSVTQYPTNGLRESNHDCCSELTHLSHLPLGVDMHYMRTVSLDVLSSAACAFMGTFIFSAAHP